MRKDRENSILRVDKRSKVMWQKARVIHSETFPWLVGREIWTKGKPALIEAEYIKDRRVINAKKDRIYTNLLCERGLKTVVTVRQLELLGGEDAFCENPPLIPFKEWSREIK